MQTVNLKNGGCNFYTKILKKFVNFLVKSYGHCDGGDSGHCS